MKIIVSMSKAEIMTITSIINKPFTGHSAECKAYTSKYTEIDDAGVIDITLDEQFVVEAVHKFADWYEFGKLIMKMASNKYEDLKKWSENWVPKCMENKKLFSDIFNEHGVCYVIRTNENHWYIDKSHDMIVKYAKKHGYNKAYRIYNNEGDYEELNIVDND